jgi:limonene-1,2-epoxide hydrolase
MATALEIVHEYFDTMNEAVAKRDPAVIARRRTLLADDIVYQNKPLKVINGLAELTKWQSEFAGCDYMVGEVRHMAEDGDWVLTERVESWSIGGVEVGGEIMGILEVRDGQIHTWFDHMSYFDDWRRSGQLPPEFFERWSAT